MSFSALRSLGVPLAASMIILTLSGREALAQDAAAANALLGLILLFCLLVLVVFFIPSIVAFARDHPNRWLILVINLVFGATGLGWLGSLIWACGMVHRSNNGSDGGESGLNLFINDVSRVAVLEQARLPIEELGRLKSLLDQGAINQEEYGFLKCRLLERR